MTNKLSLGILFGGKSAEHEVSIRSAKNIYDAADKTKYEITMIYIHKNGQWFIDHTIENGTLPNINAVGNPNELLAVIPGAIENQLLYVHGKKPLKKLDVIFPVLHGPFGEDGTVQGLLKLANIPYVGPDVLGSSIGMDKDVMKRLLDNSGIPNAKFLLLHKYRPTQPNPTFEEIVSELSLPFFVKPANLGSSVGISKVNHKEEFQQAVAEAFRYDHKLIIEKNITGREIECSVLGNENPVASFPGEIINQSSFYSYKAKYLDEKGAILDIPAKLDPETAAKIQAIAVKTFQVLCCEGLSRVDIFLTPEDEILVNEINTLPGFTITSMYPQMWENSGISYAELIDRLLQLAIDRFNRDNQLIASI